ncbi:MAG: helix-turn-helix transcriptional regulator [Gammaproteobacteria bacterium]|nr:helix-turn-helix transcriptional regulator [Gammaproteobacteria bacterium]
MNAMGKRARALLAQNLRILRLMRGWSQEQLGTASGLHRTYISLVERSACNISLDNLEKLADAFGLGLHQLLAMPDAATFGEELLSALRSSDKRKER